MAHDVCFPCCCCCYVRTKRAIPFDCVSTAMIIYENQGNGYGDADIGSSKLLRELKETLLNTLGLVSYDISIGFP